MASKFDGIPRGKAVRGAAALAAYIWGDESLAASIYTLDYAEFGLLDLGGVVTGYELWLDHVILNRIGTRRRRRKPAAATEAQAHP